MTKFTQADHALVTAAVARAELASDGEIVTIVADKSDSYHDVGLHYAVLAMLLVPAVFAFVPRSCIEWALQPFLGWNAGLSQGALMVFLFVKLAAAFLVVRFALAWMPLRMALTPGSTKSRRVRRRALLLFKIGAERRTVGRTGVLIYLSLFEHRAEIVADEAIHGRVEPEVWGDAMATLVEGVKAGRPGEGMASAVEKVGAVLAECLPRSSEDTNELPDRLIEL
ncbi:TPM domain-containing protein [Allosphingosinicella sp.]|uniref:TPM domain-containing protein n=1 Tax=Allosphingosinicella sp. TaxID=2823234 RepID=UPI003D74A2D3